MSLSLKFKALHAFISPDQLYRYWLSRGPFVGGQGMLLWIMLNPSTADALRNDPTITRVMNFTAAWGFEWAVVVNLFALRATDPEALYVHKDPVGPQNDDYLLTMLKSCTDVVCAWGMHGTYQDRGAHVMARVRASGKIPHGFGLTKGSGQPKHPLYMRGDSEMVPL